MTAGRQIRCVLVVLAVVAVSVAEGHEDAAAMVKECSPYFEKVMSCMNFATGKAVEPTKECCTSVTEIRATSPKCMCFVIQQTKNGSEQIKSLGIRADKLLQLPTACQLKNSSVSDCPKLLGLVANSPEALIFSNSTAPPSAPGSAAATKATPTATGAAVTSGGNDLRPVFGLAMLFLGVFQVVAGFATNCQIS